MIFLEIIIGLVAMVLVYTAFYYTGVLTIKLTGSTLDNVLLPKSFIGGSILLLVCIMLFIASLCGQGILEYFKVIP